MRESEKKKRLLALDRGPGVFVYDGGAVDVECRPTVLMAGREEPMFDAAGNVALDRAGRQVMQRRGVPVRDEWGNIVLGGEPERNETEIETFKIWDVEFPKGVPVRVRDRSLAAKLRAMSSFTERHSVAVEDEPQAVSVEVSATRAELVDKAREAGISIARGASKASIVLALRDAGIEVT